MNRYLMVTLSTVLVLAAAQAHAQDRGQRNYPGQFSLREQVRGVPATNSSARPAHDQQGKARNGRSQQYNARQQGGHGQQDSQRRQSGYARNEGNRYDRGNRGNRRDDRRDYRHDRRDNRRDFGHDRRDRRHDRRDYRHDRRDWRHDRRAWRRDWSHGWSGSRYRAHNRYYHPRGYSLSRWHVGLLLPSAYYAPNYYIDYRPYGLSAPPLGCQWIRVGNDVLLVDTYTGEVLDVLSSFWY